MLIQDRKTTGSFITSSGASNTLLEYVKIPAIHPWCRVGRYISGHPNIKLEADTKARVKKEAGHTLVYPEVSFDFSSFTHVRYFCVHTLDSRNPTVSWSLSESLVFLLTIKLMDGREPSKCLSGHSVRHVRNPQLNST